MQLFIGPAEFASFCCMAAKNVTINIFNLVFNEDSNIGSAHFLYQKSYCENQKNTKFVRISDYYLNIPMWTHSYLISLH
jgi:hypothetical protein